MNTYKVEGDQLVESDTPAVVLARIAQREWTKARREALEAFFINHGRARRSNTTKSMTVAAGHNAMAYWQCVDWFVERNLVEHVPGEFDVYRLTSLGWEAGGRLWNVPPATLTRMRKKAS